MQNYGYFVFITQKHLSYRYVGILYKNNIIKSKNSCSLTRKGSILDLRYL